MNQWRSDGAAGGEHFSVVAVAESHDMLASKNIDINRKKVKKKYSRCVFFFVQCSDKIQHYFNRIKRFLDPLDPLDLSHVVCT